jgi:hypothetical protein
VVFHGQIQDLNFRIQLGGGIWGLVNILTPGDSLMEECEPGVQIKCLYRGFVDSVYYVSFSSRLLKSECQNHIEWIDEHRWIVGVLHLQRIVCGLPGI